MPLLKIPLKVGIGEPRRELRRRNCVGGGSMVEHTLREREREIGRVERVVCVSMACEGEAHVRGETNP